MTPAVSLNIFFNIQTSLMSFDGFTFICHKAANEAHLPKDSLTVKNLTFDLTCHVIGCAEVNDIGFRDGSCRAIQRRLILKTSAVVSQIAEG